MGVELVPIKLLRILVVFSNPGECLVYKKAISFFLQSEMTRYIIV